MKRSQLRSMIKEEMISILKESAQPKEVISEMATFYKVTGDPEKSKQLVTLLKGRVPAKSTAYEVLDALEKDGQADLYKLKAEREKRIEKPVAIQQYNTQDLKALLENPAVEKYISASKSPSVPGGNKLKTDVGSLEDFLKSNGL